MRTALITDIHGNLHALEAVLADIDRIGADRLVCLGDLVDGCAYPAECIDIVRERALYTLCGNHEALHIKAEYHEDNPQFRRPVADRWGRNKAYDYTDRQLTADHLRWIKTLPTIIQEPGIMFVHAAPAPYQWGQTGDFLFPGEDAVLRRAWQFMASQDAGIAFVGHTHRRTIFTGVDGGESAGMPAATYFDMEQDRQFSASPSLRHIVVCSSAGVPYDGDNRAGWVLYDHTARSVTLRRVRYDVEAACQDMGRMGLRPEVLEKVRARVRNAGDSSWSVSPWLNDVKE